MGEAVVRFRDVRVDLQHALELDDRLLVAPLLRVVLATGHVLLQPCRVVLAGREPDQREDQESNDGVTHEGTS